MMLNKVLFVIVFIGISVQAFSQPVLKIEGKIAGMVKGTVRLIDLEGTGVMETSMEKGRFTMEKACDVGIYRLEIGTYVLEAYFDGGVVGVEGYVDPDNKDACQVRVTGLAENDRLMALHAAIVEMVKQQQKKLESAGSQDEWICKMGQEDMDKAELTIQKIKNESSPAFAAALAYLNRGIYYETAVMLYQALNDNGKESVCGRLLKKYLDGKHRLANGELAPDVTLQNDSGEKVSLGSFKGRVIVVDFWASWCGTCRIDMQYLKKIYQKYKEKNVEFVSVSMDDTFEKWQKAAGEEQIPWISLWESNGFWNSDLREEYDFSQIPYIVVIDAEGRIAGKNLRRTALARRLDELVK